jgi:hypothetical protein
MKKAMIVCALALLVGACATSMLSTGAYSGQLRTWVGATEEELVRWFGPPARSDANADGKVLHWEHRGEMESSTGPLATGGPVSIGFSMSRTETCLLSFHLADGVVTRSEWRALRSRLLRKGDVELNRAGQCATAFPADRATSRSGRRSGVRQKKREEGLDIWVGRTESELLSAYPVAPAVYSLDNGARLLTWEDTSLVETPASKVDPSEQTTRMSASCAMTFWVAAGVIEEWKWRGSWSECPLPESSD